MRLLAVFATLVSCGIAYALGAPPASAVLFNPRLEVPAISVNADWQARVSRDPLRLSRAFLPRSCVAPDRATIIGLARGSFTLAGRAQVTYMTRLCSSQPGWEPVQYGLLTYDADQLVGFTGLRLNAYYAQPRELYGVRDLNLDGLDEIALAWESSTFADGIDVVTLFDYASSKLNARGHLTVLAWNERGGGVRRFVVRVVKGAVPSFLGIDSKGEVSLPLLPTSRYSLLLRNYS